MSRPARTSSTRQAWRLERLGLRLVWLRLLALLGLALATAGQAGAAEPARLVLDDRLGHIEAWPHVTQRADASKQLTLEQVRAAPQDFAPPTTAYATLGLRRDAVWLRIPLEVAADSDGQWVLDIDYAVLNRVDVHLLDADGRLVQRARLGNTQPFDERPMRSRSHALEIELEPGKPYEMLLRVESLGAMILPISFDKHAVYQQRALAEQMLQGLLTGLGLCLLFYSLGQWFGLREPLFIKYVVLIGGSLMFSVVQWGIGAQFLWPDGLWLERHLAGISALVAAAGTFLFVEQVLAGGRDQPVFSRIMKGGAAFLFATALLYALDLIDIHMVSLVVGSVGLMPALMGMPGAIRRARAGDQVGWYFLAAWVGYFIATLVAVSVIKGRLPANFWTLHAFQFGATLDMLLFLRVLGLRLNAVHAAARHAAQEATMLRALAETDPLTGLPNRRGLNTALSAALPNCRPERMVALYMLDLDGFKRVNDQHGHDIGDHLLIEVAQRLKSRLRNADVVARMGGDEFIIMAEGLQTERQARELGTQLIEALAAPVEIKGLVCRVGVTVGYVLAPEDGRDPVALQKRADAAMYEGKQRGKGMLMRGEGVVGMV